MSVKEKSEILKNIDIRYSCDWCHQRSVNYVNFQNK